MGFSYSVVRRLKAMSILFGGNLHAGLSGLEVYKSHRSTLVEAHVIEDICTSDGPVHDGL
jgi:hypothetical protein